MVNILNKQSLYITWSLVKRDISAKYRGTIFGAVWNIINPLFMLLVYSTVFLHVFKARWAVGDSEYADYALMLFIGIVTHVFISEVMANASTIIRNNAQIVKKVVFPIEVLPMSVVLSSTVNFVIGILLSIVYSLYMGYISSFSSFIYIPLIIMVYMTTLLAISYVVSSLSVFVRDIQQIIPAASLVLLFTSTVFFSIKTAPASLAKFLYLNPISIIADALREIIYGRELSLERVFYLFIVSLIGLFISSKIFSKLKLSFSDAL
ncbi:ABC transporter permease [Aeromonas dhakensis]|uniref:ABC transporter permease n=1 Tax=Aeromonas dhakensis TaxID=196024 RepID=UPI00208E95D9|nr:ABC transporter permease [Aeromonas dhakensis]USP08632.1 ABC transporter permease [Aeromonas dhakensis]